MQLVFASVFVTEENPEAGESADVGGAVQSWVGFHRERGGPTHHLTLYVVSICFTARTHITSPHTVRALRRRESSPLLYFRVCRAHSVTHRQSEGNHTPSVQDSLWVFFFFRSLKDGENDQSAVCRRDRRADGDGWTAHSKRSNCFWSGSLGVLLHFPPFKWSVTLYIYGGWRLNPGRQQQVIFPLRSCKLCPRQSCMTQVQSGHRELRWK